MIVGKWDMESIWVGHGELPESLQIDPWLGWPLQQGQGTHQQCDGYETLPILQGIVIFTLPYLLNHLMKKSKILDIV